VQREGKLVGIITETDLLNALVEIMDHATMERIAPDYQHRTMTVIDL
jgi:CBS domain-containing protein